MLDVPAKVPYGIDSSRHNAGGWNPNGQENPMKIGPFSIGVGRAVQAEVLGRLARKAEGEMDYD